MQHRFATGSVLALGLVTSAFGLGAWFSRPANGAGQPSGVTLPAGAAQYACLTLSDIRDTAPEGNGRWEFQDPTGRYDANAMSKLFGTRSNEINRALVVTLVAGRGWELVSHSDATAFRTTDMRNGTGGAGTIERAEQWWFRKR